jgi:WD40 repeat protein
MNLPTAFFILRCLVRDTFRQAVASSTFWLMLSVSGLCILLCLSTQIEGGETLRYPEETELLKDNKPLTGPRAGLGSIGLLFGAVRIDLPRDGSGEPRVAGVHFLQTLLGFWVAGTVGLLAALIWTAGFVPAFLQPSAAAILLAKPVPRSVLLVGKWLGVLVFVGFQEAVFFGGTWLALGVRTGVWSFSYLLCIPLILLQFAIIYSFSVLVGVMTRSTVASIFGALLFWFLCYAMNYGRHETVALRLGNDGQLTAVTFQRDGRHLASGSAQGTIKIWDAETGQVALSCHAHSHPVAALAFSPDGGHFASIGSDGTLQVRNAVSGQEPARMRGADRPFSGGLFHPDGRCLLWLSRHSPREKGNEEITLWDAATGQDVSRLGGHSGKIGAVAVSSDGRWLATASADGCVIVWDAAAAKALLTLRGHKGPVTSMAFRPDGRTLASASADRTVRLWDLAAERNVFAPLEHKDTVLSVGYSPDGRRLASASADNEVIVWDVATAKKTYALSGAGSQVAFSPDGRHLASAGADGTLRLWDTSNGELARTFPGSFPETLVEYLVEAGYWILPKPADLLIVLDQTINAGEHFDALPGYFRETRKQDYFFPELSLLASLLFTLGLLGVAARQLVLTDY